MAALSILDLSPIVSGSNATQALRDTVSLAQHAESLGAARVWLAEHHNAGMLASSAPEILSAHVASATRRIRVGAGGMMLPNHSALRVAEQFRLLSALYPGRIDLGLGRAAGTDPRTARLLRRGAELHPDEFEAQFNELLGYLEAGPAPRAERPTSIIAIPTGVESPELFLLGSSDYGARLAAERGLGFAFAHHMNPSEAAHELQRYRANFRPSRYRATPWAIASVNVVAASTDAQAEELAASGRLALVRMAQGQRDLPLPSPAEVRQHTFDEEEEAVLAAYAGAAIVGGPERVRAALFRLVEETAADELLVMTQVHDQAARRASYTLVAELLAAGASQPA